MTGKTLENLELGSYEKIPLKLIWGCNPVKIFIRHILVLLDCSMFYYSSGFPIINYCYNANMIVGHLGLSPGVYLNWRTLLVLKSWQHLESLFSCIESVSRHDSERLLNCFFKDVLTVAFEVFS